MLMKVRELKGKTVNAILDTNILIDFLKAVPQAKTEINRYSNRMISIITWMEVMAGSSPANEAHTRQFLATFLCLPITEGIAERAVKLRRNTRLKLPDAVILATAQIEGALLVTRNSKDFSPSDPQVRIPYTI
jgi:predicted nucleic acid-binding protein